MISLDSGLYFVSKCKIFNRNKLYFCLILFASFFSFKSFSQDSRATIPGTVSDQFGILPGSKITIEGTNLVTTTDNNGFYSFPVDEGDYVITTSFVMYKSKSVSITVKVEETVKVNIDLETCFSIDEAVSIGSRANPTSILKTIVPVDVFSSKELNNSSHIELSQVLHYLVPTFHSTHQTISDDTDHVDSATLRGLGPDQVLVLINGKRIHNSALLNVNGTIGKGSVGTDFNTIPIAAIDKIEILRDGSPSNYGSDAIAGVINIILKNQSNAINIDAKGNIDSEGDGETTNFAANFGLKIGKKGFINLTGEYRERGATNRAGNYTGRIYSEDPMEDAIRIQRNDFFNKTGFKNNRVMEIGSAETQNLTLFFNSEIPLSDSSGFYLHGGRNFREGKAKGFYRFPKDQDRVVLELFPNGFSPEILTDIRDDAIVAGFKGKKNGWRLDFSHSIGNNELDYTINNSNNASLGVASPKTFYAGSFTYTQNTTNFDAAKSFEWLKGVNVAFGGVIRLENYTIIEGEEDSFVNGGETFINGDGVEQSKILGVQVFTGIQPENELNRFRTNSALYVDIETSLSNAFIIQTAARYEEYNDFAGQAIWKLSGRYLIKENLSARAGYFTGFRAPSLHQVFFQNISSQFIDGEIVQVGTFNNESSVASEAFQIGRLKPELSKHVSIGFSGKTKKNWSYSLYYYNINIDNRIVPSGRFAEGYEDILAPFNVGTAQFFTNAIDSKTSGIDLSINYKYNPGAGELNASVAGNVTRTKVKGSINVTFALINQENVIFNREEIACVESVQPNFKFNNSLSYEWSKFKVIMRNTVLGEVEYIHPDDELASDWVVNDLTGKSEPRDQIFDPKIIIDLLFTYQATDFIKITLGSNNIFNIFPDALTHSSNIDNGNFIYSRRVQQFGVNGTNFFTRIMMRL